MNGRRKDRSNKKGCHANQDPAEQSPDPQHPFTGRRQPCQLAGKHCQEKQWSPQSETEDKKYGESRQAIGLGTNNQVVEVFASLETGTWTITVTTPAGVTCLVASGQSFETLSEAAIVPGEMSL